MIELTREQLGILDHTLNRAAGRRYCGEGKDMEALCALGLMRPAGRVSWVPEPYYTFTKCGIEFLEHYNRVAE
jgi:hypothetical protein